MSFIPHAMRSLLLTLLLVIWSPRGQGEAHAHPLSYTEATVVLDPNDQLRVQLTMDASDLPLGDPRLVHGAEREKRVDAIKAYWSNGLRLSAGEDALPLRISLPELNQPPGARRYGTAVQIVATLTPGSISWTSEPTLGRFVLNLYQERQQGVALRRVRPGQTVGPLFKGRDANTGPFYTYLTLGLEHIIPDGTDHIAFVMGLFLIRPRPLMLLQALSTFTVAHSITLIIATSTHLSAPRAVVEPLIAISLIVLAVEALFEWKPSRSQLSLVFLFGLVHGLGFAEGLREHLDANTPFLTALLSFNLGVELGQIAVIALPSLLLTLIRPTPQLFWRWCKQPLALLIGSFGVLWTIERLGATFTP